MTEHKTSRLEQISNVAVIVVAVVSLAVFARYLWPHSPTDTYTKSASDFKGQRIDLSKLAEAPAKANIVLGLSTHCRFCSQNTDFYRKLATARRPGKVALFAVLPEGPTEIHDYLRDKSINLDHVASLPLETFHISATPTVLLADSTGRIHEAWVGALDDVAQQQVLAAVSETR